MGPDLSQPGMQVRTKLVLVLSVPLAVCVMLFVVFVVSRQISERSYRAALAWNEHAIAALDLGASADRYIESLERADDSASVDAARAALKKASTHALVLARQFSAEEQAEEAALASSIDKLLDLGSKIGAEPSFVELADMRALYRGEVVPKVEKRANDVQQSSQETAEAGRQLSGRLVVFATAGALVLLGLGLVVGVWLTRTVSRSLAHLSIEANRIANGDLGGMIRVASRDELGLLAASFNTMTSNLRGTMVHRSQLETLVNERTASLEHANLELQESEHRHRALFDLSPVPVCAFAHETGAIVAVNERTIRLYGYSREELLAMTIYDLAPGFDVALPGDDFHVGVVRYRNKTGGSLEIDTWSHALEFGGVSCVLAIGVDVTAARKLEEQLRQSQKMDAVGQLAGGIAHDFNNLLTVILSNTELAHAAIDPAHPAHADLEESFAATMRAAELTRQLLAFGRKQTTQPHVLQLNSVVSNLEKMLRRIIGEDIAIQLALASALANVYADAGQLEQVLTNLAVNARDAMPDGGSLTIETANVEIDPVHASELGIRSGPYVRLTLTDTGCGMDELTRARAFEPFFTTKTVGSGTGLGLSMVFGIIKQHEGIVELDTEPGRGTTFRIYLPSVAGVATVTFEIEARPTLGSGTILVVEDEDQVRSVTARMLRAHGYRVFDAASGRAALALIASVREPIDLMLSDLVMPDMDGRALAKQVREQHPRIKIMFMSGYTKHPKLEQVGVVPDEHFLAKPFTLAALTTAVRAALDATPRASAAQLSVR